MLLNIYSSLGHPRFRRVCFFIRHLAIHQLLINGSSAVNGCHQKESPHSWWKHHNNPQKSSLSFSVLWSNSRVCRCHESGCHSLHCTSPMDYISHHALHTHIPVHHYTNHTAVTIHSLVLIVSPHLHLIHSHTFKQHSHMHPLRSLVSPG